MLCDPNNPTVKCGILTINLIKNEQIKMVQLKSFKCKRYTTVFEKNSESLICKYSAGALFNSDF